MAFEDVEDYRSSGLDNHQWCLVQNSDSCTDLYGELQNTAERFKQLAVRLQKTASKKDLMNEKGIQTDDCCEETKTKLMEYIAENLRLRQSLKDVSDINHRWQDYNCDRQKHVQHLQSTVLELRRTINDMKEQSRKMSSTLAKDSEIGVHLTSELCRTTGGMKQTSHKLAIPTEETETNESNNLNEKLSREVRVLSRQLKEARNESKALKLQLEKVTEENNTFRTLMKTYKSEWEGENRKKLEALSEAQRVVQELCMLKVNGTQNRQTLNNLNLNTESGQSGKNEQRVRHKKLAQTAATIIQSIDGIEVHLQERCSAATTAKVHTGNQNMAMQKELDGSTSPIVTFPDSDSEELTMKEQSIHPTTSQHLICPVCNKSFLKECGSQFLDHYTTCKLYPGKDVSCS